LIAALVSEKETDAMKSGGAGCTNCGSVRFSVVHIYDNGDLALECSECGTPVFVGSPIEFSAGNRDKPKETQVQQSASNAR
jgi:hypothetical protein